MQEKIENLTASVEEWRKRALLNGGRLLLGFAAVAGVSAFTGYVAQSIASGNTGDGNVWLMGAGGTAAIFGAMTYLENRNKDKTKSVAIRNSLQLASFGAVVGAVITALVYVPMSASYNDEKGQFRQTKQEIEEAYGQALLKNCGNSPCQVVQGKDGKLSVEPLAHKYNGKSVIFTFGDNNNKNAPPQILIMDKPLNLPDVSAEL
ncbi:MAG: hypothetical protein IT559_06700 [Alphaproteobacteria bacterium]|nr:hypothetical protein [Alphaproteobacteria bacterium]